MATLVVLFQTMPAALWICKCCQFMVERSGLLAGGSQILFLIIDNI
jgi:hypothetical protein